MTALPFRPPLKPSDRIRPCANAFRTVAAWVTPVAIVEGVGHNIVFFRRPGFPGTHASGSWIRVP